MSCEICLKPAISIFSYELLVPVAIALLKDFKFLSFKVLCQVMGYRNHKNFGVSRGRLRQEWVLTG